MHDAYDLLTPDPADRDAPPEQAPPPADVGRESRRAALKDLVSLASHAADTEAAVERVWLAVVPFFFDSQLLKLKLQLVS
ncbi:MAG TPA: hypothetical protein VK324_08090 [Tepidisphaeraceae bacterium]|nr:hypothetical protein [Tepidisphaeraceae bacterium]